MNQTPRVTKHFAFFLLFTLAARAAEYSDGVRLALEQLRATKNSTGVPVLGGRSSGYGGVHGTFYLLWPYFFARATPEDVALMLNDPSPLIRILGARRILEPFLRPLPIEALDVLAEDKTEVRVGPIHEPKEHFEMMTVSAVVERMKREPNFLFQPFYGERVQLDSIMELQPLRSVRPLDAPLPAYPPEMARAGLAGEVILRFVVKTDGSSNEISVVRSSHREFESTAKEAVARWRFSRPPPSDGHTVESPVLECRVVFAIKDE